MYYLRNPKFEEDYKAGYIFFSFKTDSFISKGIALFTRFENTSKIPISHCGIITGPDECVEAAQPGGVQKSNFVKKYIENPMTIVFLRVPFNLDQEKTAIMEAHAIQHLGKKYAIKGVIGSALLNLVALPWIKWWRKGKNPFNDREQYFCSELVSESMIKAWPDRPGCLIYHPTNIYPTTLFEDNNIFKPWRGDIVKEKRNQGKIIVPASI